jgi:LacI family transcriptional regulator
MPDTPHVILCVETARECGRGILLGVVAYCRVHGYWRLSQEPPSYTYPSGAVRSTWPADWRVDGLIASRPEIPDHVLESGLPIVGIDVRRPIPNLPNIVGDADAIARMAAEHFLERGFTQFAYCGFEDIRWARERGACFVQRITEAGFRVDTYHQPAPQGRVTWDQQPTLLAEWLKNLPKPTALFACNDDYGRQVTQACRLAEIQVPDEVAVLAVDNDEMVCLLCDPRLSSIALNFERAGYEAAELLDRMMRNEVKACNQRILLKPTHVSTRQSTDVLAIPDAVVARAARFIRENAREGIQVEDVAKAVCTSRRTLQHRFRKTVGRSVGEQIRRVRLEHITRMLIETNLNISEIATNLGYTDAQHIARYFRIAKGMSPQEFRRQYRHR